MSSDSPNATGPPTTPPRPSHEPTNPEIQYSPRGIMHASKHTLSSGMYDNLSASRAQYPQHASHNTLQGELSERVVYNDQSVLKDLRITDVPDSFVKFCTSGFHKALAKDIEKLTQIQMAADGVPVEALDQASSELRHQAASTTNPEVSKTAREREMYEPLVRSRRTPYLIVCVLTELI